MPIDITFILYESQRALTFSDMSLCENHQYYFIELLLRVFQPPVETKPVLIREPMEPKSSGYRFNHHNQLTLSLLYIQGFPSPTEFLIANASLADRQLNATNIRGIPWSSIYIAPKQRPSPINENTNTYELVF